MERVGFVHSLKMVVSLGVHLRILGSNPFGSFISSTFFTYSTVKMVEVPNSFIAVLNRLIQLIICTYIAL